MVWYRVTIFAKFGLVKGRTFSNPEAHPHPNYMGVSLPGWISFQKVTASDKHDVVITRDRPATDLFQALIKFVTVVKNIQKIFDVLENATSCRVASLCGIIHWTGNYRWKSRVSWKKNKLNWNDLKRMSKSRYSSTSQLRFVSIEKWKMFAMKKKDFPIFSFLKESTSIWEQANKVTAVRS